jgi:NAD(P)-dependent dehydrogenase (short-subunit alcohol dehydrogenase family)
MAAEKVVLVTGATSGIGEAIVDLLPSLGYRVFGTTRKTLGGRTASENKELVELDVDDEELVRSCVQTVVDRAGRIDALVNNAGYALLGAVEETSVEEAKAQFETNFFGVLRLTRIILPIMRDQGSGRIINISSVVGFLPAPFMGIYAASKHAIEGYSESLDHEVRQFGIRVSLVEPGFTRTHLSQSGRLAGKPLGIYDAYRTRALDSPAMATPLVGCLDRN